MKEEKSSFSVKSGQFLPFVGKRIAVLFNHKD